MVVIKNIRENENEVSFEYYPENEGIKHSFKYNKETKEVIEHIKSDKYKSDVYAKHAYRYVKKLIEQKQEIPLSSTVAWY